MPVLVLSGCRGSRSHSSALRNQDHPAAKIAGLGAFVDTFGVRQKPALEAICKPEFTQQYFYGARIENTAAAPGAGPNDEVWGDSQCLDARHQA